MRALFLVLLIFNLALAGLWYLLSSKESPDAGLLDRQLHAEQIRIIPAKPFAAVREAKSACVEWGSFAATDLNVARAALEALQFKGRVRSIDVAVIAGWWVYIPPLKDKAEVEKKIAELQKLGVEDYYAVEAGGSMNNAVSLGIFRSEEAARAFLARMQGQGVRSAVVGQREHRVTQTAFQVRDADVALTARLAELRAQFPGSELKAIDCP